MNASIQGIIDHMFRDTVDNMETRALHEELLNNCLDHYEDLVSRGMSETEAIDAVVESLKGMKEALQVPIGFDTDVNGSLLGEVTWGAAQGLTDVAYITIGTGVGGGILSGGKVVHGMLHPEMGHVKVIPAPGDTFAGRCPFHGNCLEGMAAGPALKDRWGKNAHELVDIPEVWEYESDYLAQACVMLILTMSPQKIILGGGVMHQMHLFPLIRTKAAEKLNGYLETKELADMDNYIVPAGCNDDQGILGAVKLGLDALGQ